MPINSAQAVLAVWIVGRLVKLDHDDDFATGLNNRAVTQKCLHVVALWICPPTVLKPFLLGEWVILNLGCLWRVFDGF